MEFKVGQKVECLLFGRGIIEGIDNDYDCTIMVRFANEDTHYYTREGKYNTNGRVTLTPGNWNIEENLPEPEFEEGQPVWVRDEDGQEWRLRYYKLKENKKHFVFCEQNKSGRGVHYNFIKPFEGIDPNE